MRLSNGVIMSKHTETRKRLITILGFLILFVTFVVKDAIKEQVKDEVASLESADSLFTSTVETAAVFSMVVRLKTDISISMGRQDTVRSVIDQIEPYCLEATLKVRSLRRLVETLPEDSGLHNSLDDLVQRNGSLIERVNKIEDELKKPEHVERKLDDEPDNGLSQELRKLAFDVNGLLKEISNVKVAAVQKSAEIKQAEQQKLKYYTYLSYALYGLGWSLAFYGRLTGVEGVEAT